MKSKEIERKLQEEMKKKAEEQLIAEEEPAENNGRSSRQSSSESFEIEKLKFDTIRQFFDHMSVDPRELDGLGLETLIRDCVNDEIRTLR